MQTIQSRVDNNWQMTDLAPDATSWASVKDGKYHATVSEKPQWDRDEESLCGLTIRPRNVTWGEAPPTNRNHICAHCANKVGSI